MHSTLLSLRSYSNFQSALCFDCSKALATVWNSYVVELRCVGADTWHELLGPCRLCSECFFLYFLCAFCIFGHGKLVNEWASHHVGFALAELVAGAIWELRLHRSPRLLLFWRIKLGLQDPRLHHVRIRLVRRRARLLSRQVLRITQIVHAFGLTTVQKEKNNVRSHDGSK